MNNSKPNFLFDIHLPWKFPADEISNYATQASKRWTQSFADFVQEVKIRIVNIYSYSSSNQHMEAKNYFTPWGHLETEMDQTLTTLKVLLGCYLGHGIDAMVEKGFKQTNYVRFLFSMPDHENKVICK